MEWAAWVQAIGSIGAIVIAGRTVELTARRTRLERLYGVDGIFLFCAVTVRDAANKVNNSLVVPQDLMEFPDHRLADCCNMLGTVSGLLVEIGSEKLPKITSDASELMRSSVHIMKASKIAITTTRDIAGNANQLASYATTLESYHTDIQTFVAGQEKRVKRWWIPLGS